uniref:Ubiquitin-like protease family profile domain-containing protein n=1 Tax=Cucumis melo TaxID=3656 RepID=A0A9I9EGS8_CUCME
MIESLKDFTSMRPIATACLDAYIMNHWTLVVINLTKGAAFWIDTLKNRIDPDVTEVVERSFNIRNKNKPNWRVVKCPKQSGVVECGYYVMWFMRDIIISRSTSIIQIMKDSPRAYTQDDIDCIRSEWAEFVGKHVLPQSIGANKPYLRQFIDV